MSLLTITGCARSGRFTPCLPYYPRSPALRSHSQAHPFRRPTGWPQSLHRKEGENQAGSPPLKHPPWLESAWATHGSTSSSPIDLEGLWEDEARETRLCTYSHSKFCRPAAGLHLTHFCNRSHCFTASLITIERWGHPAQQIWYNTLHNQKNERWSEDLVNWLKA